MTRHQRNATAGCVYTYHERKKDAATSGYGTNHARLGTDSVKGFDCCSLSLQPCKNPVITPDGWLYEKEAILEYILHKKQEIERQMKEYEKQTKKEKEEELKSIEKTQSQKLTAFMKNEASISSKPLNPFQDAPKPKRLRTEEPENKATTSTSSNGSVSNMESGKDKVLPSFWIPSHTPQAEATQVKKPDKTVYCPMSKKPLKMKHLLPVEFMLADESDSGKNLAGKRVRYKCAVTHDILTNSTRCAVIKTSGKVVTMDCVERLIKKDMRDPFTGESLKESDIIPIKGGTGFAGSGADLEAKKARPVMMAS